MKIGFIDLLTLLLVALKLLGKIHISWLLVFTPMLAVYAVILALAGLAIAAKIYVGGK